MGSSHVVDKTQKENQRTIQPVPIRSAPFKLVLGGVSQLAEWASRLLFLRYPRKNVRRDPPHSVPRMLSKVSFTGHSPAPMMLPPYLRLDWCHHLKQKEESRQRFHYRFSSSTFTTLHVHVSASQACLTEHSLVGPTELWVPVTIQHYKPHQRNLRVPHTSLTLVIMKGVLLLLFGH